MGMLRSIKRSIAKKNGTLAHKKVAKKYLMTGKGSVSKAFGIPREEIIKNI